MFECEMRDLMPRRKAAERRRLTNSTFQVPHSKLLRQEMQ